MKNITTVILAAGRSTRFISDKSKLITFYGLCGFANLSSVGILISGLGSMAPERKQDFIDVSFKALIAATLASCMTGLVVGLFI